MMDTTPIAPAAAPAESAPATEVISSVSVTADGESTAVEVAPPSEPPKPSRLQQRIDDLTRQRYDEQRGRETAEANLAALQRQQTLYQQFSQLDAEAPNIASFDNLHSYNMAMADWTTKRASAIATAQWEEREQKRMSEHAQFSEQAMQRQHQVMRENVQLESKMASGAAKYPDFMKVVTNPDLPSTRGTPLFEAVLEADNAVDIAYALAKNPAELDRLLSLRNPLAIAREVFRLDAKFTGSGATNAPPPPPSRSGSAVGSKELNDPTLSDAEFAKKRKAQIAQRH